VDQPFTQQNRWRRFGRLNVTIPLDSYHYKEFRFYCQLLFLICFLASVKNQIPAKKSNLITRNSNSSEEKQILVKFQQKKANFI
jgi:hypothetical protein